MLAPSGLPSLLWVQNHSIVFTERAVVEVWTHPSLIPYSFLLEANSYYIYIIEGLHFCKKKAVVKLQISKIKMEGINGRLEANFREVSDLRTFNKTHWKFASITHRLTALMDYLQSVRTYNGTGIIFKPLTRDFTEDGTYVCDTIGDSYCERFWDEKHVFVTDWKKTNEEGHMFCQKERFKGTRITLVI